MLGTSGKTPAGSVGGTFFATNSAAQPIAISGTAAMVIDDVAMATGGISLTGGDTVTLTQPGLYLALGYVVTIGATDHTGNVFAYVGGTAPQISAPVGFPGALSGGGGFQIQDICYVANTPKTVQVVVQNNLGADTDFSATLFIVYLGSGVLTW